MKPLPTRHTVAVALAAAAFLAVPSALMADCGAMDPRTFGAVGNGCTDDRAAIQAAADAAAIACGATPTTRGGYVALSPGKYRINSKIHLAPNVGMIGNSPLDTQILVSDQACAPNVATFNMADTAVILLDNVYGGPNPASTAPISGFGITFRQPDTSDRSLMTQYPVAIRADVRPYMRFSNIWITNAWDGISLLGDAGHANSGGSTFSDIYMSVYNYGFNIDDAQDSMRITRLECAPNLLMTANQAIAMQSVNSVCIRAGRLDDLHVTDSTFLNNTGVYLYQSANGMTFGSIVGSDFDNGAQLRVLAGTLNVSGSTFTNSGSRPAVHITGGDVRIDGGWIFDAVSSAQPTVSVSNTASSLIISDTTVSRGGINLLDNFVDRTLLLASGAGNVRLDNVLFRGGTTNTATPTRPIISFTNNTRGSVNHCFMHDTAATVPGVFLNVADDQWVSVIGNQFMNWKMVLPANANCPGLPSCLITARLNNGLAAGSSPQRDAVF
jgi:hypothetical protein